MVRFRIAHLIVSLGTALLVSPALAQHESHDHGTQPAAEKSPERVGDPYPLATCPVSGEKLGEMGDPVIRIYDGREIRFCCEKCVPKFEADQEGYLKKINKEIVKEQGPFYPATSCPVSGEPLEEDGEDIAVDLVIYNRLVRVCCNDCRKELLEDPKRFFEQLDKTVADAQRESYSLQTCPVSGEELGKMGEPVEVVVANHLVKLCCKMCKPKLDRNPSAFLEMLDKAWEAAGMPVGSRPGHEDQGQSGHDEHGHDGGADHEHHHAG